MGRNLIAKALSSNEQQMTEEFANALTFCIGFGVLTTNLATDALDALTEAHPEPKGGLLKMQDWRIIRKLQGNGTTDNGLLHKLLVNIRQFSADSKDVCFWFDFGNTVHSRIEPTVQRFTFAIANSLGRSKQIAHGDNNLFARLIVAQSIASLGAEEVANAKRTFSRHTITMYGRRTPIPPLFEEISCEHIGKYLRELNISLIEDRVPDGFSVFDYAPVSTGVKAVTNLLRDPNTWDTAIMRSVELNDKVV